MISEKFGPKRIKSSQDFPHRSDFVFRFSSPLDRSVHCIVHGNWELYIVIGIR